MHPVNISQLKAPRFAWGFLYEMQRIPVDDLPILRGLKSVGARDSIEILWYLIPVRCTIELTEKEQWGSYPLFLKKGMPVHGRGLDISMPELK